jgi:carboxypeptidase C (cathepsin A)
MKSCLVVSLLAPLAFTAGAAAAAEAATHRAAVTHHTTHINGRELAYTATVAEDPLRQKDGSPGAAVVTISYTLDGVADPAQRPVLFAFNGGPGASSSPLHMSAMGPRVHADDSAGGHRDNGLIDNTSSPLDVSDLVFIDPVSTGFSHPLPGVDPQQWYGGKVDAVAVATVIQDWLKSQHREKSPKYVAGESYGTTRAGLIVKYAPELKLDGVLLVSGGGSSNDATERAVDLLANMAVGAWYHKKVDRRGLTAEQFYHEALAFGRGDYSDALKNPNLTPGELHQVALRVAAYIGLPAALIESSKLQVSRNAWMFNVLREQGLRTGLLDTRATGKWCPNMQGGIDDPAMGFVPSDTCAPPDKPPTPASVGPRESPAVGRYLREELEFADDEPYYGVNLLANSLWGEGAGAGEEEPGTAQIMAAAMRTDVHLRLAAISGFYDLGSAEGSAFARAGIPVNRLTLLRLASGHEVYDTTFGGEEDRKLFNDAVREFVTAKPAATLPELHLTLKPHAAGGVLDAIDATMEIHDLHLAAGEPLVQMALVIASIPTARYDGNALQASDDEGPLSLTQRDGTARPFGTDRDWLVTRATSGPVTVRFRIPPRQVDANTRPGPLFDLRAESGGLMGSGLTFLPHPLTRNLYHIQLTWDLSTAPPTDRGMSCFGDGNVRFDAIGEALASCYYAVGPLQVYPPAQDGDRDFGMYWLTNTPFDVPSVAAQVQKLFAYMSRFFHDTGGGYRVLIRKNPYASGGGTASHRSFMFGWNEAHPPTDASLEDLLAHEMTHNWPRLSGEHGQTSWYGEGSAEYYSILLSWRAGVISSEEFLKRINGRAANYYRNPLQTLTL